MSPQPGNVQQVMRAIETQPASQLSVQQVGSTLQTPAQQTSSSHPPVSGCASKQEPTQGQGQLLRGTQSERAACTHEVDQLTSQQTGSFWQTTVQQVASSQPGVGCVESHGPFCGQSPNVTQIPFAMATHSALQPKLQQSGSTEQTAEQQSSSEQPGLPCTTSGEPAAGQLLMPRSQPNTALAAQVSSHAREQQVGSSTLQTYAQHLSSSQLGR
jgi:hypothetical protein